MAPARVVDYAGARAQIEHDLFDTFQLEALVDLTAEQFNIVFSRLKAEPPPQNNAEEMAMKRNFVSWLQRGYPHLKDERRMPTTHLIQASMALNPRVSEETGYTSVLSNNGNSEATMRRSVDNISYDEIMPACWAAHTAGPASASPTALAAAAVQCATQSSTGLTSFDDGPDDEVDHMSVTYTATQPLLRRNASPDNDSNSHLGAHLNGQFDDQCGNWSIDNIIEPGEESDSDSLFVPMRSSKKAEIASRAPSVVKNTRSDRAQSVVPAAVSAAAALSNRLVRNLAPPPVPHQSHPRILRSTSRVENAAESQHHNGTTVESSATHVSESAVLVGSTTMARRSPNPWVEEPAHQKAADAHDQGTSDSVVSAEFPAATPNPTMEECEAKVLAAVPATFRIIEAHIRDGRTKDALEGLAEVFSKVWFVNAASASAAQ